MSTRGRKCLIFAAVAILALVSAGSVSRAYQQEGYQPAGAWAWTITPLTGGSSSPALVTLHHNGTVSVSAASMFNTGAKDNYGKLSLGHGVWERTGAMSFGGTTVYMHFDDAGILNGFLRASTALYFTTDPDHIAGTMYMENASCADDPSLCGDPLSPDLVWTRGRYVDVSGTRSHRLEVPVPE